MELSKKEQQAFELNQAYQMNKRQYLHQFNSNFKTYRDNYALHHRKYHQYHQNQG